jgi:hypothetical protein
MAARGVIDTSGISDLLRDLGKIDKGLRAAMVAELRDIGNSARDKVRSGTQPPFRTGKTRRSFKTSVKGGTIAVYSLLPQAPVWQWGGSIKPRGVPIEFPRTEFVTKEVEEAGKGADERLAGLLDATAARYEFE